MTFIPLEKINFVKHNIKNDILVKYKNSDSSTFIYDQSIDSKSILPGSDVRIKDDNLVKQSQINFLYTQLDKIYKQSEYGGDTLLLLDHGKNKFDTLGIDNNDIKLYNFKNEFKISKINQRFLPDSDALRKKDIFKKIIYPSYNENYNLDYYTNLNFGFCNYNTINFFSNFLNNSTNTHSNCVIYPNTSYAGDNTYNFIRSNEFSLSFYLNQRKKANTTPNCIIHIPGIISVYSIYKSNTETYNISVSVGSKNLEKYGGRGINYSTSYQNGSYYFFDKFNFDSNKGYNNCLFVKSSNNSRKDVKLYIDGELYWDEVLLSYYGGLYYNNSYIAIGNKPNYINRTSNLLVKNLDDISYYYFGTKASNSSNERNGPSVLKDISFGNGFDFFDSRNLISTDEVERLKNDVRFEDGTFFPNGETESFHGEIHDIRIYNSYLSKEKVVENLQKNISNLSTEIDEYSLEFYVPVLYVPLEVKGKSLLNLHEYSDGTLNRFNVFYNNYFNPYLFSFCGIMHISVENYLVEFVKAVKPNVTIDGVDGINFRLDTQGLITKVLNNSENIKKMQKGIFAQHIYNDLIVSDASKDEDLNKNNLSYRNLMILPNDNGLLEIDFNVISSFIDLHSNITVDQDFYKINDNNTKEFYNITNSDILNKNIYLNNKDEVTKKQFVSRMNNFTVWDDSKDNFNIVTRLEQFGAYKEEFTYSLTNNSIYDLSNFIYHDVVIGQHDDLGSEDLGRNATGSGLHPTVKNFKEQFESRVYPFTKSNPVNRFYHDNLFNINIPIEYIKTEKIDLRSTPINYLRLPTPYCDINQDFDNPFISIFDVPTQIYNKKIKKGTFILKDSDLITTGGNISLTFKDNKYGTLYRADCLTKQATWNYVGNIFYQEGLFILNNPILNYVGEKDFEVEFVSETNLYVNEINIPCDEGLFDVSRNKTYDETLRHDESALNSEESFVYITDINLHDENLNIVARAKMARPIPKKSSDNILIRLKMDY